MPRSGFTTSNAPYTSWVPRTITPFSVSVWVYADSIASTSTIWSLANTSSNNGFHLNVISDGTVDAWVYSGGVGSRATGLAFYTGRWVHLLVTYGGDADRELWSDGNYVDSDSGTRVPASLPNAWTVGALRKNAAVTQAWPGAIGPVAMWNARLDIRHAKWLALGVHPTQILPQNLIAYYAMEGPQVLVERDLIGYTPITTASGSTTLFRDPALIAKLRPAPRIFVPLSFVSAPVSSGATYEVSISESAGTASDTPVTAASIYNADVAENAGTVSDTPLAGTITAVDITETAATIADSPSALAAIAAGVDETANATDPPTDATAVFAPSATETASVADSPSNTASLGLSASESAGTVADTTDASNPVSDVSISESCSVADSPSEITQRPIHPAFEILTGTWTPEGAATLPECIDELVANRTDFIKSAVDPVNDTCQIRHSAPDSLPDVTIYHVIEYEIKRGTSANLDVQLYAGTTHIKTWQHVPAPSTWTPYSQTLSSGEAASIPYADYPNLSLKFIAY